MNRRITLIEIILGILGSSLVLWGVWQTVLRPLGWPPLDLVLKYVIGSATNVVTFKAMLMTGVRAICGVLIGFSLAVILGIFTGRSRLGWIAFFFLLMLIQKIPAIAMVHVLVKSRMGIGFFTTITLAATVVLTFSWQVLHHRASTLNPRELFALRLVGFRGWQLFWYGLLPHLGSALGGAARLAVAISLVLVILGEWQGVWSDGTIWQHGLGIEISRAYDSVDSEARVLSFCVWLGLLGIILDLLVQGALRGARSILGVDFRR